MITTARTRTTGGAAVQDAVKSGFDRAIAAAALVLLAPLLIVIAVAVKLDSPGPVLFRQARTGQGGRAFAIFKFRSMRVGAGLAQATRGDARVTRVGAFLRRTSLDELPQLLNVLTGDMALVGPRPHALAHDEAFAPQVPNYMARYAVRPGMTGWAQINNARGETETTAKMARRVALDLEYIRNRSLLLDLRILLATPLALLGDKSVY